MLFQAFFYRKCSVNLSLTRANVSLLGMLMNRFIRMVLVNEQIKKKDSLIEDC